MQVTTSTTKTTLSASLFAGKNLFHCRSKTVRRKMSRNVGFFICFLILAMDVSAGILGIEAEVAQNKVHYTHTHTPKLDSSCGFQLICLFWGVQVKHLKMWIFECRDPSHTAFKYGLAACILLVLAHVTANFLGGCLCVVSRQDLEKSSANRQLAVASLIFSW